jgi:hypothetical protein
MAPRISGEIQPSRKETRRQRLRTTLRQLGPGQYLDPVDHRQVNGECS